MKPQDITKVMDLVKRARDNGDLLVPLFSGAPGIGKSKIIQQWARENKYRLIDLRLAYFENVDLIGLPSIETVDENGSKLSITKHNIPEFWNFKKDEKVVLLFDEPNRGATSVMNALMQILTDEKVHTYDIPKNTLMVAAVNPEGPQNDVNFMDSALKNRFLIIDVQFDKKSFVQYLKQKEYKDSIIQWVDKVWTYVSPEEIKGTEKYLSGRNIERLNIIENAVPDESIFLNLITSELGMAHGKSYYEFTRSDAPIGFNDILENEKKALTVLKRHCDPKNYRGDKVDVTISDILEHYKQGEEFTKEMLIKVVLVIPPDRGHAMIQSISHLFIENGKQNKAVDLIDELNKIDKNVSKHFREILKK